jgi:hypothetical protein
LDTEKCLPSKFLYASSKRLLLKCRVLLPPGKRFVFGDDLVLERYDDSTPGSGLSQNQNQRLAGTQSGVLTIVRIAAANDRFFPANSRLVQFEGTYKFNTLDDTPLQKGQVTAQGVLLFGSNNNQLEPPVRLAITGGIGPYNTLRERSPRGFGGPLQRLKDSSISSCDCPQVG